MRKFLNTIKELYGDYDIDSIDLNLNSDTNNGSIFKLGDTSIIQKQYIIYYLYRIICKNYIFFSSLALQQDIKNIFELLEIKNANLNICIPLANRMTTDKNKLNNIFKAIMELFDSSIRKIKETRHKAIISSVHYSDLYYYLESKSKKNIIKDINKLYKFIPNLSEHLVKI